MKQPSVNDGDVVIFRPVIRLRNGKVLVAKKYGLQAWPIRIPKDKLKN